MNTRVTFTDDLWRYTLAIAGGLIFAWLLAGCSKSDCRKGAESPVVEIEENLFFGREYDKILCTAPDPDGLITEGTGAPDEGTLLYIAFDTPASREKREKLWAASARSNKKVTVELLNENSLRERLRQRSAAEQKIRCLDRVEVIDGFYAGQQGAAVGELDGEVYVNLDNIGPNNKPFAPENLKLIPKDGAK